MSIPIPAEVEKAALSKPVSFMGSYKKVFLSGLATILPTVLTFWVLTSGYSFIDRNAATPINSFLKDYAILGTDEGLHFAKWFWDLSLDLPAPREKHANRTPAEVEEDEKRLEAYQEVVYNRFPIWLGFVLAIALIFIVGFFIASFIGRTVWGLFESWILKIPIIRSVYPSAKQMVDFLLSKDDEKAQFNAVVAIEYPMRGVWTLGFITGEGRPEVRTKEGKEMVTVFIPFAPTPISGFVCFVNKADCIGVDMTVDEAFKFYISGGVIGSVGGSMALPPDSPSPQEPPRSES
jgi:uncharacterized membrane protein